MSKGNPKIQIRLTPAELAQIESSIHSSNARRPGVPYDLSSWVRHAIKEKLDKLQRSRKSTGQKKDKETGVYYTPVSDSLISSESSSAPHPEQVQQSQESESCVLKIEQPDL